MKHASAFVRTFAALALMLVLIVGTVNVQPARAGQTGSAIITGGGVAGEAVVVGVDLSGVAGTVADVTATLFVGACGTGGALIGSAVVVDGAATLPAVLTAGTVSVIVNATVDGVASAFLGCSDIIISPADVILDPPTAAVSGSATVGNPLTVTVGITNPDAVPLADVTATLFAGACGTGGALIGSAVVVDGVATLPAVLAAGTVSVIVNATVDGVPFAFLSCSDIVISPAVVLPSAGASASDDGPGDGTDVTVDVCIALFDEGLVDVDGNVIATDLLGFLLDAGNLGISADVLVLVFNGGCEGLVPPPASAGASASASDGGPGGGTDVDIDICIALFDEGLIDAQGRVIATDLLGFLLDAGNLGISTDILVLVFDGGCQDFGASASPSASGSDDGNGSGSASPSASGSVSPSPSGVIVVITGALQEDDDRANDGDDDGDTSNDYDYFLLSNSVQAAAEGDLRLAGAGEQTYVVALTADGSTFSQGATDAEGMVTLDAPEDEAYYIYEIDDTGNSGSADIEAGESSTWLVIEYVSDLDDEDGSPSGSAGASASGSAAGSGSVQPSGADDDGSNDDGSDDDGDGSARASNAGSTGGGGGGGGGTTALPNTGAGGSDMGSSMTWALVALMAVVGVVAAGFGLRRRTV